MEVETPMLVSNAGGAAARPFETHYNALDEDVKLRISLELYLKRLIVGGHGTCLRNRTEYSVMKVWTPDTILNLHLMELYQAYTDYERHDGTCRNHVPYSM